MGIIEMSYSIIVHPSCVDEIKRLMDSHPRKAKADFQNKYDYYSLLVKQYGPGCVQRYRKYFEKIVGAKDLYSIRFRMSPNIRILYAYEKSSVVLLLCMEEKEGHDYKRMIPIAEQRLKKYREERLK